MALFRLFLVIFFAILAIYTAIVIAHHGTGLLAVFFRDIAAMTWPGQFNFDFMGFLMLSALWTAWRNNFSAGGLALAVLAGSLGMLFLAAYLLLLSFREKGNMRAVLLGARRPDA